MKDMFAEAKRGLNDIVTASTSDTWVNKNDKWQEMDRKLAKDFNAEPVSRSSVENSVSESVDGLPVKDRDLVDDNVTVDAPEIYETERVVAVDSNYDVEPIVASDVTVVENPAFRPEASEVPTGTIKNITAWVGDDKDRAQAALDAELAKDDPRTTLVEKLEDIVGTDEETA